MALDAMDPAGPSGADGQTVGQRLDELVQRKESIHLLAAQADVLRERLSDQDWVSSHDQIAALGEEGALRWLVSNARHN